MVTNMDTYSPTEATTMNQAHTFDPIAVIAVSTLILWFAQLTVMTLMG